MLLTNVFVISLRKGIHKRKLLTFTHVHGIVCHKPAKNRVVTTGIRSNANALATSLSANPTSTGTLLNATAYVMDNYLAKVAPGGTKNAANVCLALTLVYAELMSSSIQTHVNVLAFQSAVQKATNLTQLIVNASKMDAIGGMITMKIRTKHLLLASLLSTKTISSATVIANASALSQLKIASTVQASQISLIVVAIACTGNNMDQINQMQI